MSDHFAESIEHIARRFDGTPKEEAAAKIVVHALAPESICPVSERKSRREMSNTLKARRNRDIRLLLDELETQDSLVMDMRKRVKELPEDSRTRLHSSTDGLYILASRYPEIRAAMDHYHDLMLYAFSGTYAV